MYLINLSGCEPRRFQNHQEGERTKHNCLLCPSIHLVVSLPNSSFQLLSLTTKHRFWCKLSKIRDMEHEKVGEFVLNSDYEHALRPNFRSNVIVFKANSQSPLIGSLIRIIPRHFATSVAEKSAFHWQLEDLYPHHRVLYMENISCQEHTTLVRT